MSHQDKTGVGPPLDAMPKSSTTQLKNAINTLLQTHRRRFIANELGIHHLTMRRILAGRPAKYIDDGEILQCAHEKFPELRSSEVNELCKDPVSACVAVSDNSCAQVKDPEPAREPRFLLTPDTFIAHQLELGEQYVQFARSSIEITRRLLDLAAQHDSAVVRQRIQDVLTSEVQELYLAIKRYSSVHPNKLLDVFAAESAGFALDRKSRTSRIKR
jgi:hypothetical protein